MSEDEEFPGADISPDDFGGPEDSEEAEDSEPQEIHERVQMFLTEKAQEESGIQAILFSANPFPLDEEDIILKLTHEIKLPENTIDALSTPLAGLSSYSSGIILRDYFSPEERKAWGRKILAEAKQMKNGQELNDKVLEELNKNKLSQKNLATLQANLTSLIDIYGKENWSQEDIKALENMRNLATKIYEADKPEFRVEKWGDVEQLSLDLDTFLFDNGFTITQV